ncbi:hypothetical protein Pelo_6906 [Pelomyxa schiedti]|nr:hypothetical protein Pelo_6906 [Pelomyxa schiedti]
MNQQRVAILGPSTSLTTEHETIRLVQQLLAPQWNVVIVQAADVVNGILTRGGFAALLVCGGVGPEHAKALQFDQGRNKVLEFISQGGAYIGICGGAYLATKLIWGLVDYTSADFDNWDRGCGPVLVKISPIGCKILLDEDIPEGVEVEMDYANGPLFISTATPTNTGTISPQQQQQLGRFTLPVSHQMTSSSPPAVSSTISLPTTAAAAPTNTITPTPMPTTMTPDTMASMIDRGAVVTQGIGGGRVVLFATHPERGRGRVAQTLHHALVWALGLHADVAAGQMELVGQPPPRPSSAMDGSDLFMGF